MKKIYTFFAGIFMISCLIGSSIAAVAQENDTIAPVVLDFQIEFLDHTHNDSVGAVFTVEYSEAIQLVDTFTIVTHYQDNETWVEYEVYNESEVAVEGNKLTITPQRAFLFSGRYELIIIAGAVTDMEGNRAQAFTRTFVADQGGPFVENYDLAFTYNTAKDSVSAVFTLTYNENVRLFENFIISTHVSANGGWEEYDVYDSSEVTVQGNIVTIRPNRMFSASKRYELVVAFGAVLDMAGNMATSFTRVFVADTTPPEVTNFQVEFTDASSADSVTATLTLTYSEDVQLYRNFIIATHVRNTQGWVEYERIADTSVVVSGNTVTINPMRAFSRTGTYELVVAAGALIDLAGNRAPAYTHIFLRDSVAPRLIEIQPNLAAPVPVNAPFVFTFDENVRLATPFGFYTYQWDSVQNNFIEYERLEASQAKVNGNVITFTPTRAFLPNYRAQIILTAGSVMDLEGNRYINVTDGDSLSYVSKRFWTSDRDTAYIVFNPADGDSITAVPEELTIDFNGEIALANGNVTLESVVYLRHNGNDLDHQVSHDTVNHVITIVPAVELAMGNSYTYGFTAGLVYVDGEAIPAQEATFVIADTTSAINDVAIVEIHGDTVSSPLLGQEVRITGTITGIYPNEGFYVQDDNAARSGIWVQYTGALGIALGEGVSVTGTVDEEEGIAVLVAETVAPAEISVAIEPIVIQLGTDSIPMYQGVLVQFENLRASAANEEGGWWLYAEENADSVSVSSQMFAYTPVADNSYNLTGIVTVRQGVYSIEPRMEADVVDVTIPSNVDVFPGIDFRIYPNPFNGSVRINNHDKLSRVVISNITGQRVIDINNPASEINTSQLVNGVYIISLFNDRQLVKTERIVKQ